jgi:5-formyltetrahydrofolate cyclo-ligase
VSAIDYSERQLLRQHIRHLRRHLTPEQQSEAAEQLAEHAINLAPVSAAQSIALFLSTDGEINTRPLIARLWQQKKRFICRYCIRLRQATCCFCVIPLRRSWS